MEVNNILSIYLFHDQKLHCFISVSPCPLFFFFQQADKGSCFKRYLYTVGTVHNSDDVSKKQVNIASHFTGKESYITIIEPVITKRSDAKNITAQFLTD